MSIPGRGSAKPDRVMYGSDWHKTMNYWPTLNHSPEKATNNARQIRRIQDYEEENRSA